MPTYKNHPKQQLPSGKIGIGIDMGMGMGMGMRFILSGLDLLFLMRGARGNVPRFCAA